MEATQLELPAEMNIAAAADIKGMLLAVLDEADGDIEIDALAVSRVDAAGIQLLAAMCQTLRQAGRGWTWSRASDELADAVMQLGLNDLLALQSPGQT